MLVRLSPARDNKCDGPRRNVQADSSAIDRVRRSLAQHAKETAMFGPTNRRRFLRTTAAGGALAGLGDLGFLSRLKPVSAAESRLDPKVVRLQPEIEPLVRLLEETPREQLLEQVADRIHKGLSYRELLAALLLAGVRNIQPRPAVGFKFHAVL